MTCVTERAALRDAKGMLLLAAGLAVAVASCRRGPQGLAVVGGRPVTAEALRTVVETQTGKPFAEAPKELVATLFEGLLEEEVVLSAGGVAEDRTLPPAARSARIRELMATLCPPPPPPADAEVTAWLEAHPEQAVRNERIRLRQLILPDEAAARGARERVQRGEDFAAVSKELSRAPNAADGGMLGWFEKGQLTPEFEAVVFGLPAGSVSEPVASNAGWHVFQVMERHDPASGIDAGLMGRVRAEIGAAKAEAARRECVRRLATQVGVEVRPGQGQLDLANPFQGETR
jgi:hypothetical protein